MNTYEKPGSMERSRRRPARGHTRAVELLLPLLALAGCYPRVVVVDGDAERDAATDVQADAADDVPLMDAAPDEMHAAEGGLVDLVDDRTTRPDDVPFADAGFALPPGCEGRGDGVSTLTGEGLVQVALGPTVGCALVAPTGRVYCWGETNAGERGAASPYVSAMQPPSWIRGRDDRALDNVVQLAVGSNHVCAVKSDGALWCWGQNESTDATRIIDGRTGVVDGMMVSLPAERFRGVRYAIAGSQHTCVILQGEAGSVRCFGADSRGQLGNGTGPSSALGGPEGRAHDVMLPRPACSLAAGRHFTCALLNDGSVHCWGLGNSGVTGRSVVVEEEPRQIDTPSRIGLEDVRVLRAGTDFACALGVDGVVQCWGGNYSVQLGENTTPSRGSARPIVLRLMGETVREIALSGATVCARMENDEVRCRGGNGSGALGQGRADDTVSSTRIETVRAAPASGEELTRAARALALSGSGALAGGFCLARYPDAGGGWLCWGDNQNAQLGHRSGTSSGAPTPFGPLPLAVAPPAL